MPMTEEELDRKVLYWLGFHLGKEHAINRWDLVEKVYGAVVPWDGRNDDNAQDREIRFSVNRLRAQGHLICDLGDGNGRWIAATEAEFWEFYSYYVKPIKSRAEIARALKASARQAWPNLLQPSLFEVAEMEVSDV